MLKLIPLLAATIASYVGWAIGRPFGVFLGALLAIVGGALGGYYGKKLREQVTP